jgi:hypothetical protein
MEFDFSTRVLKSRCEFARSNKEVKMVHRLSEEINSVGRLLHPI